MYILSENGQEAFSKFMSNLVTQSVLGSICLLLLYRAVYLPIWTYQWLVFWIFTLAIISFLFFWCFTSFMQFIKPLNNELDERIKSLGIPMNKKDTLKQTFINFFKRIYLSWKHDKVIFWQVIRLFISIEVPAIFLFIASAIGAVQIAATLGW
ncbi:hypothetical protein ACG59Z_11455 [Acinetobacter sp. ABJ_C1_1]|uniref:hypothetical protein n=1 Tax=Acinetobacter sp. ABJ_C1_1 TaxID=3378321 RepID=UPI0037DCC6A1